MGRHHRVDLRPRRPAGPLRLPVVLAGGYGYAETDTISQTVTVPACCAAATLNYWLHIDTAESGSTAYDLFEVKAGSTTLSTLSNADAASGYTSRTLDLSAYAGQRITLTFTATEDAYLQTSFVIDDVTLQKR
ncbi:hypothetical protein NKH18_39385 [Streptomyces sp. M10(2022)]